MWKLKIKIKFSNLSLQYGHCNLMSDSPVLLLSTSLTIRFLSDLPVLLLSTSLTIRFLSLLKKFYPVFWNVFFNSSMRQMIRSNLLEGFLQLDNEKEVLV